MDIFSVFVRVFTNCCRFGMEFNKNARRARSLIVCGILALFIVLCAAEDAKDTREGEDVTLECRFSPQHARSSESLTYWWARSNKQLHDNVAIGEIPLDNNYKLEYHPEQGRYDLKISNASYDRDNGRFECRVKAGGTGQSLHSQSYQLTVLTLPQQPVVAPGTRVTATEDHRQELTCSSTGGSPDPVIRWYREGSTYPLEAALKNGGSRDQPTVATLNISPVREDDGAVFRCVVWNRAMPEGTKLDSSVALSVNYFPRVDVGPENPLRVERDSSATLQCTVDAKPKVQTVKWTRNGRYISNLNSHVLHRVSLQDAGKYTCSADNALGKAGEKEITLDVLYGPVVTLESKTKEAEEGEHVSIKCNVSANPHPTSVEWLKEGKPDFRQPGDTLRLSHVVAEHSGTYVCRATNIITPSSLPIKRSEKIGNSSIALLIRHKPGKARITPEKPIAIEGSGVTLTCTATPPGWPAPQYRWFKVGGQDGPQTVLATGTKYTIPNAHLGSEGVYNCQATNELGHGEMTSINLEVHQPPKFIQKLAPLETKKVGEPNFAVSCTAKGKPRPSIRWLKNGEEITADVNMYEVKTESSETNNGVVHIQSTLKFSGRARPSGNQLLPSDRGIYTCMFENQVKKAESSMHLRIEHEPIVLHQYNKVAYDLYETAEVLCKIQAYPKPEFKWYFESSSSPLQMSSEGHYEINTSVDENDVYTSILKVSNIKMQDYGEYNCEVVNKLGTIAAKIKLQSKGAPEKPKHLLATNVGHNFVTLSWEPGFNGGIMDTKFFVQYRKIPSNDDIMIDGCGVVSKSQDWSEVDCLQHVPCNVSNLEQHQSYVFKVKAFNTKGNSDNSDEYSQTTKVDKIPIPHRVAYDPSTRGLSINIPPTCLALIAVVESMTHENTPVPSWQIVDTLPLQVSGTASSYKEALLDNIGASTSYKNTGRSLVDEEPIGITDDFNARVRVKLCLRAHHEHCGDYIEAELGTAYIKETSALATPTLIAIVVSCIVFILFVGLLLMFCRCKRNQTKKSASKDYEMDSVRPTIVTQQSQAPPPYYATTGMENKALEHSMDLALAMEDPKNPVYATQNGYGYHVPNTNMQGHPGHQNINGEWVNMGYLENSYSNSNNGGSVNSQDSLWQMKMAAAANNSVNQMPTHHMNVERQNSYGYDPITHGGYGAVDDYAPYPHITTQSQHGDDYMRNSNNPSRQEYCSDPYAAVHKPKKRIEQHIDSPYHDVSGLPDPYLEQMDDEKPPQHMSLSYEESLESGYSTPNSRTRRVIREIIV